MKALQFDDNVPRYALAKVLGLLSPAVYWSGLGCLRCREVDEPPLPGPDWARVRVRYAGICGSDLGMITLHGSPSVSAYMSFPFTMGHENVGTVTDLGPDVQGFDVGERVVVGPLLDCRVRGFDDPCPACARGDPGVCERRTEGVVGAGIYAGFCAATGGSWSRSMVGHRSQLLRVPEGLSDENALMSEPFAIALHNVMRNPPADGETVLVLGAGVVGLCVVAALRALGYGNRVLVAARHGYQADWARQYGADQVLRPGDEGALAEALGAGLHRPVLGRPLVSGGAEVVYECVGSGGSLDTAVRFTREGGTAVILGLVAIPRGIDWSPIWLKEITVRGCYLYGIETWQGRRLNTMDLALELLAQGKPDLSPLVTHCFPLADYRRALGMVAKKSRHRLVKAVFEP